VNCGLRPAVVACIAALALCALPARANAQSAPQPQRDIEALIASIRASDCRFERNGRWYDAAAAQAHLRKKYDYLRKRGLADSAESFIERGASRSSISGKPYRVRCGGAPASESGPWFRRKLGEIRGRSGAR
jgi:hypothetical protein